MEFQKIPEIPAKIRENFGEKSLICWKFSKILQKSGNLNKILKNIAKISKILKMQFGIYVDLEKCWKMSIYL